MELRWGSPKILLQVRFFFATMLVICDAASGEITMENVQVVIQCVRCRESYRLSYPNPQEILENQSLKPTATSRAAFWCQGCGFVFSYNAQDVRFTAVQMRSQNQIPRDTLSYRISFRCGQENCEAPVILHTVTDAETSHVE